MPEPHVLVPLVFGGLLALIVLRLVVEGLERFSELHALRRAVRERRIEHLDRIREIRDVQTDMVRKDRSTEPPPA